MERTDGEVPKDKCQGFVSQVFTDKEQIVREVTQGLLYQDMILI